MLLIVNDELIRSRINMVGTICSPLLWTFKALSQPCGDGMPTVQALKMAERKAA